MAITIDTAIERLCNRHLAAKGDRDLLRHEVASAVDLANRLDELFW